MTSLALVTFRLHRLLPGLVVDVNKVYGDRKGGIVSKIRHSFFPKGIYLLLVFVRFAMTVCWTKSYRLKRGLYLCDGDP